MKVFKTIKLVMTLICAVIFAASCEDVVTTSHNFNLKKTNLTGEAKVYVTDMLKEFKAQNESNITSEDEASTLLSGFCREIEQGVESKKLEVIGDGAYAQFTISSLGSSDDVISTQTANFKKTRDYRSYAAINVDFESLLGDQTAIKTQLKKLSFYQESDFFVDPDNSANYIYQHIEEYDMDDDMTEICEKDANIINDLFRVKIYEVGDVQSVFTTRMSGYYIYQNEKLNLNIPINKPEKLYVNSPLLHRYSFNREGGDSKYPEILSFDWAFSSEPIEAPYFSEFKVIADDVELTDRARRAGAQVNIGTDTVLEIISFTEAKLIKYKGETVDVDYTVELDVE